MLMDYLFELRRDQSKPGSMVQPLPEPGPPNPVCLSLEPEVRTALDGEVLFAMFLDETFIRHPIMGVPRLYRVSVASVKDRFLEWMRERKFVGICLANEKDQGIACDVEACASRQGLHIVPQLSFEHDGDGFAPVNYFLGLQWAPESLAPFIRSFLDERFKWSRFGFVLLTWFCDEFKKWGRGKPGWDSIEHVVNPENCRKTLEREDCNSCVVKRGQSVWLGWLITGDYIQNLVSKCK